MLLRLLTLAACAAALALGSVRPALTIPFNDREPSPPQNPRPPRPPHPQPPVPGTLPVTTHLSNFTCHNADEDNFYSNGDEPYLFVAAIYADGTTIQLANLANAKVRIKSPSKTHGNLGRTRVKARNSFAIPAATGLFSTSILPIAGLPDNLGKEKSTVGLIVIAMEEDATKTSAANAGQQALVNVLQKELTNAVRTVSALDVDTLRTKLSSAIRQAIKKESLSSITGIFSFVDPDDYIGADFAIWSYQQIENAGSQGMPISMNFKKSGVHYQITGSIRAF